MVERDGVLSARAGAFLRMRRCGSPLRARKGARWAMAPRARRGSGLRGRRKPRAARDDARRNTVGARHGACAGGAAPGPTPRARRRHMSHPFHDRFVQRRQALLQHRARELRWRMTASEQRLWQCLVSSKLGVAFRRQYVIGERIADFAAPSLRLVVEVDGSSHAGRRPRRRAARAGARAARATACFGWKRSSCFVDFRSHSPASRKRSPSFGADTQADSSLPPANA